MKKRVFMCVSGVLLCGVSVGLFKTAAFGVDPFQTFMSGTAAIVPIPFGVLYMIVNACLLLFALRAGRSYIGLGTVINLFLLGYVVEFTQYLMGILPFPLMVPGRLVVLAGAIVLNSLAAAMYFTANLGVSPYDAISLIVTEVWKKGVFKYNRIISDGVSVMIGLVLCILAGMKAEELPGVIGMGTIITMFFMGPLVQWFRLHVTDKMLQIKEK
ncbi:MAG: hypothetical protein PHS82_07370 [Lachnospiraceae bacterium]|nr:hypothetical protein [Lachnospiraceae bacterium]